MGITGWIWKALVTPPVPGMFGTRTLRNCTNVTGAAGLLTWLASSLAERLASGDGLCCATDSFASASPTFFSHFLPLVHLFPFSLPPTASTATSDLLL